MKNIDSKDEDRLWKEKMRLVRDFKKTVKEYKVKRSFLKGKLYNYNFVDDDKIVITG